MWKTLAEDYPNTLKTLKKIPLPKFPREKATNIPGLVEFTLKDPLIYSGRIW